MSDWGMITEVPDCPPRPSDAHKGVFGTVIVVGGCATMIGAPALCASAALRSGAGLVKIAAAGELLASMIEIEPGATGIVLGDVPGGVDAIDAADPNGDAVMAIGPGMGQSDRAATCVAALLRSKRAVVLDADGLNLLAKTGNSLAERLGETILTPHPGEFARLCESIGIQRTTREDDAVQLARAHGAVVVLKGQASVITDGQRVLINTTGNPAMATAGSGDVLTGLIAALIAQGMGGFEAAALGAYLHGLAGDLWAKDHGLSGLTASDLARRLPDAFEQHRKV